MTPLTLMLLNSLLVVIATCKKQQRNFFSYLHDAIVAHLHQQAAPSLLSS